MLALGPRSPGPLHLLVVGAHPDDIEIGCGGTLLVLAERHCDLQVTWVVATGSQERRSEALAGAELFMPEHDVTFVQGDLPDGRLPGHWVAAKELLEDVARSASFDVVLAPSRTDSHQDHRTLAEIVPTVWRDELVLGYEIPKLDGDLFRRNAYVPLPDEIMHRKLELLDKAFPSQHGRQWWDHEMFTGLARIRGVECRSRYAEAFHADKLALEW
jgi:LmbE family N-acetylglucosaminyl deacetylase